MKFKKICSTVLAGIIALSSLGAYTASASSGDIEWEDYWTDIRPDSDYELTVGTKIYNGEEKLAVKLANLPQEMFDYEYDYEIIDGNRVSTYSLRNLVSIVYVGEEFIAFTYKPDNAHNPDIEKGLSCGLCEPRNITSPPSYSYALRNGMFSPLYELECVFNDDEKSYEVYFDIDDEYGKLLLESESTTVVSYASVMVESSSLIHGTVSSHDSCIGFMSDGTVTEEGRITNIPIETVKITKTEPAPSTPDTSEPDTSTPDTSEPDTSEPDTSEPDTSTPADFTAADKATGIEVSAGADVFPEGTKFEAKPVAEQTTDTSFAYDLTFTKDGEKIQPEGDVTVKLPVPEALKGKDIYVYHISDEKKELIKSEVKDGFVIFTTNKFSVYIITSEKSAESFDSSEPASSESAPSSSNGNPSTGIALSVLPLALAASAVIVIKKRK